MIKQNVPLKYLTNYNIGGPAKYYFLARNENDIIEGLKEWKKLSADLQEDSKKLFILGSGTNLLIDDLGYNGLVVHDQIVFTKKINDQEVEFGSGLLMSEAINYCLESSLSGFEWAGGLPGSIGGAIRGNAGAFGGEIKDNSLSVRSINIDTYDYITRSNPECHFSYRSSIFKEKLNNKEIIVSGLFSFKHEEESTIDQLTQEKINYRTERQPLEYPSAGSTFKNIPCSTAPKGLVEKYQNSIKQDPFPVIPVARLLSDAGLKGLKIGDAQFSEKHPNFIINRGQAKSSDVLGLIGQAKKTIKNIFDIDLELEIMYLEY